MQEVVLWAYRKTCPNHPNMFTFNAFSKDNPRTQCLTLNFWITREIHPPYSTHSSNATVFGPRVFACLLSAAIHNYLTVASNSLDHSELIPLHGACHILKILREIMVIVAFATSQVCFLYLLYFYDFGMHKKVIQEYRAGSIKWGNYLVGRCSRSLNW